MFDKFKDRIAKFEEDHDSLRKVHQHVADNKLIYAVVGTSATTFFITRHFGNGPDISAPVTQAAANKMAVSYKPVVNFDQSQNVIQNIINGFSGHCCKIVQDADHPTKLWPMIKDFCEEVAQEQDTTAAQVRRMVNRYWRGEITDVFGHHPKLYGVTTTS